jgi:DNA-binding HxlR family transcriptional regulator
MDRRSYGQYCSLARALDVVGERWTLLIVRDLLLGPKRFTDLLAGLPGIGRNLLTSRLRHLESEGLINRERSASYPRTVSYELTADGQELAFALAPLARWGARRLGARDPNELFRPTWTVTAMANGADLEAAHGVRESYQIDVEGEVFHVLVNDGRVEPRLGPGPDPAVVILMDADTNARVVSGATSPLDALAAGTLRIEGSSEAFERCLRIFAGT